jgi:hypothetical protein
MRNAFKQIPEPLQKQILYRLLIGIAVLIATVVFLISPMDTLSVFTCAGIMVFFFISSFLLFRRAVVEDYVVVSGECLGVTLTAVRKRVKTITMMADGGHTIQVLIKQRSKMIRTGARITLYISKNMPLYERDGFHRLHSYLAIEAT